MRPDHGGGKIHMVGLSRIPCSLTAWALDGQFVRYTQEFG